MIGNKKRIGADEEQVLTGMTGQCENQSQSVPAVKLVIATSLSVLTLDRCDECMKVGIHATRELITMVGTKNDSNLSTRYHCV